ncbi:hypothetical protein SKAU_G00023610 [Synaphobranchus kaupii]|uniref:Uncharacterized protein n=1 Tax=Synaphobranchus kaupii TaxID=118154 RepID=A0A9Q1JDD2_SYNKA|nr:hypothetical protein SKAU_G00023610 [Synaphobranchus kaupii]
MEKHGVYSILRAFWEVLWKSTRVEQMNSRECSGKISAVMSEVTMTRGSVKELGHYNFLSAQFEFDSQRSPLRIPGGTLIPRTHPAPSGFSRVADES